MIKYFVLYISFFIVPLFLSAQTVETQRQEASLRYRHLNLRTKEITGYSHYSYQDLEKEGIPYLVESNENTTQDGKAFSRKRLYIRQSTGEPELYQEIDFRENFQITNTYQEKTIETELIQKEKQKNLSIEKDADLIPFEMLWFYLKKNFSRIIEKPETNFTLFLPVLAFEFEERGLPISWCKLPMVIYRKESFMADTPSGKEPATRLLIKPGSLLILTLLPRSKSEFRFVVSKEKPHHILEMEIGEMRYVLDEIQ